LPIHLNGAPLQNHGVQVNDRDAYVLCNCEWNNIVQCEGRVPTPAVEPPIKDNPFIIVALDENRTVVPNPEIIGRAQQEINLTEINLGVFKELNDMSRFVFVVGNDVNAFPWSQRRGHLNPACLYVFCAGAVGEVVRPLQPSSFVGEFLAGHGVLCPTRENTCCQW
jgi:hypothetical protein